MRFVGFPPSASAAVDMRFTVLLPFQHRRIRSYIGAFGARFAIMAAGRVRSFQKETPMADEKNIDVQATSDELNDESLNETSGDLRSTTIMSCGPSSASIGSAAPSMLPFCPSGSFPRGNALRAVARTSM